jgi:TDG/mug DNA glycosylase family protein
MSASLPDILAEGLDVVFCGINPGARAASSGHHFVGKDNRFWRVLHLSGFTPVEMLPADDRALLNYRCWLTTVVERPTARADELSSHEIVAAATMLQEKIETYRPRYIAFLGKSAYAAISRQRDLDWGVQREAFGGAVA